MKAFEYFDKGKSSRDWQIDISLIQALFPETYSPGWEDILAGGFSFMAGGGSGRPETSHAPLGRASSVGAIVGVSFPLGTRPKINSFSPDTTRTADGLRMAFP